MWSIAVLFALLSTLSFVISSGIPVDDSFVCKECKKFMTKSETKWSNATEVEETLKRLDAGCKAKWNLGIDEKLRQKLCDKVASALVQIPVGIFDGLEGLGWDVSLGVCATFGMCQVSCCDPDSPPEQVHLSLASVDRSVMAVSWITLNSKTSVVEWSTDASLDKSQRSEGTTLVDAGKAGWLGMIHRAIMTDLSPATTYYYRVGDGDKKWSQVFSFNTYTPGKPVTFAVIADMAYDHMSDDTVKSLTQLVNDGKLDVVIHSGDISYADGYMPNFDNFFNKIQPIASRIPYMVTVGNHEFGYNFTVFKTRFFLPGMDARLGLGGSGDGLYYSWQYAGIRFLAMDSETAIDTGNFGSKDLDWAKEQLETTVDRTTTPWVVAHFHRPLYCSFCVVEGKTEYKSATHLTKQAEDLFYSHKVDLVISGHVHSYERSLPVYKQVVTPGAPVYLMQGASGNHENNKGPYPPADQLPAFVASAHNDVGYGLLTVSGDAKTLSWSFYNSSSNLMLDYIVYNHEN